MMFETREQAMPENTKGTEQMKITRTSDSYRQETEVPLAPLLSLFVAADIPNRFTLTVNP